MRSSAPEPTSKSEPAPAGSDARERRLRALGTALLVAAAIARLLAATLDLGVVWPDEVHQSLEQAHRLAFGTGLVPWEFRVGARSWILPGLLAGEWKLAAALGVTRSLTLVAIAKTTMALASTAAVALSMRLARRLGGERARVLAAALVGFHPMLLAFGARALGEVAATPLVLAGVDALCDEDDRRGRASWLAGAALGLATVLRPHVAVVLLVAVAAQLLARRDREGRARVARVIAGAAAALVAGGLVDALTWGAPFQSTIAYVRANLNDTSAGMSIGFPLSLYAHALVGSTGVLGVILVVVGLAAGARRGWLPLLLGLVFVAAHLPIGLKKSRFLVPAIPLLLVVAAIGLARLGERLRRAPEVVAAAAVAIAVLFGVRASRIRLGDLGAYRGEPLADASPWHALEDPQRALALAGELRETCGVTVFGIRRGWSGGYTYLHRDVPLLHGFSPDVRAAANVVVGPNAAGTPPGYARVDGVGDWSVFVRPGGCAPPPRGWQALERW